MPEDDPLVGVEVPPTCLRWPTCEGYLDDPQNPYPGDCNWPDCFTTTPTEGTPA